MMPPGDARAWQMPGGLPSGPAGSWYTWWQGDALPALAPLAGLTVAPWLDDEAMIALATGLAAAEVAARHQQGHRAYRASVAGAFAGYGWSTSAVVVIRELRLRFTLPADHRYIWNCATEPKWRGHGVYPRLLQAVVRAEMPATTRFWIGHAPGNLASARGMLTAGFQPVVDFEVLADGGVSLSATGSHPRALVAARVLGLAPPAA
jgi:hypothetical protein